MEFILEKARGADNRVSSSGGGYAQCEAVDEMCRCVFYAEGVLLRREDKGGVKGGGREIW